MELLSGLPRTTSVATCLRGWILVQVACSDGAPNVCGPDDRQLPLVVRAALRVQSVWPRNADGGAADGTQQPRKQTKTQRQASPTQAPYPGDGAQVRRLVQANCCNDGALGSVRLLRLAPRADLQLEMSDEDSNGDGCAEGGKLQLPCPTNKAATNQGASSNSGYSSLDAALEAIAAAGPPRHHGPRADQRLRGRCLSGCCLLLSSLSLLASLSLLVFLLGNAWPGNSLKLRGKQSHQRLK